MMMHYIVLILSWSVTSGLRLNRHDAWETHGTTPIHVGNSFEFEDEGFDSLAEELLSFRLDSNVTLARSKCTQGHHFFTKEDCKIFTSQETCKEMQQHPTLLATYPGSGNTWMRLMLEDTLSIYTGSVFNDESLKAMGMKGEGVQDPAKVLAIKTHWPVLKKFGRHSIKPKSDARFIVVVRDPLHAALSFTQINTLERREQEHQHAAELPESELKKKFDESLKSRLRLWKEMAMTYKDHSNTLVIRFEDVVANPRGILLNQVLPNLHVDTDSTDLVQRLDCAIHATNENYGTTRRKHSYAFKFTDEHKQAVESEIGEELLRHYGYSL